jgi:transcriptional regulator with XRE-family HTH domain
MLPRERSAATDNVEPPEVIRERHQIRFVLAIGQLVYNRRTALGLAQASLAERLGMTVDEVEAIELGALVPRTEDLWNSLLLDMLPELFPWARFLPEADLQTFAAEAVDTLRTAHSGNSSPPMAQLLIAWQHTAEAHSAPDLLAALTREHDEDHGPAADPQDTL